METPLDPRMPVLVGVGTCSDDAEAVELMVRATRAAGADAGAGPELLAHVERIAVPRGTWAYTDPARIVAERIGATAAETHLIELGIPQQTPIDQALAAILDGSIEVAVVVGAEARARAARAAGRGSVADATAIAHVARRSDQSGDAAEIEQHGAVPDVQQAPQGELVSEIEIAARLLAPVEQYALIESALRAAGGVDVAANRRQVAELWARMNAVAQANPDAAFASPMTADDLAADGAGRPLAFPYAKWHVSQWTVDQGAALVLCSVAAATRFGVPREKWLFPLVGVDSSFSLPLTKRRDLHRWPAMQVLGRAAEERLGRPLRDLEHAEVYSCFPAAVRVQQRELGLPLDGTPTVTGGMTFAGGPFNNFVLQATAAMARRLRAEPGQGLVTTVSGYLTKPGLAVWSTHTDGRPPLLGDLAAEASAATDSVAVQLDHMGPATIAAVTVTFAGSSPSEVLAILDTDVGDRVVARTSDRAVVDAALTRELIGCRADVVGRVLTLPA